MWAALAAGGVACAPALPEGQPHRALVRDLARVVDVRSRVGWLVDESELQAVIPDAMKSVCQVSPYERAVARGWVDARIADLGGDVVKVWRARGKSLSDVQDLLLLSRVRLLLARADEWARQERCPFWLEPSDDFRGVHVLGTRLVLTVEGGGRFTEEFALGEVRYGGGGSGRLLGGYHFGETWGLLVGAEFGGSARFTNLRLGEQSEFPELVALAAAPLVLRWHYGLSTHLELEAGPMAHIGRAEVDQLSRHVEIQFDWGYRVGLAVGGSYLRLARGVIPKFGFAVTIDQVPGADGRATLTQFSVGFRTGIDLSRWRSW